MDKASEGILVSLQFGPLPPQPKDKQGTPYLASDRFRVDFPIPRSPSSYPEIALSKHARSGYQYLQWGP